jgi:hypothetical protein
VPAARRRAGAAARAARFRLPRRLTRKGPASPFPRAAPRAGDADGARPADAEVLTETEALANLQAVFGRVLAAVPAAVSVRGSSDSLFGPSLLLRNALAARRCRRAAAAAGPWLIRVR